MLFLILLSSYFANKKLNIVKGDKMAVKRACLGDIKTLKKERKGNVHFSHFFRVEGDRTEIIQNALKNEEELILLDSEGEACSTLEYSSLEELKEDINYSLTNEDSVSLLKEEYLYIPQKVWEYRNELLFILKEDKVFIEIPYILEEIQHLVLALQEELEKEGLRFENKGDTNV